MHETIRVVVWNEFIHEREKEEVRQIYPNGIHATLAEFLSAQPDMAVKTATLQEPEHGLSEDVVNNTDVLLWWGHAAHEAVQDEIVVRVHERVLAGMGLIVLHSGHFARIFKKLLGTSGTLNYREAGEKERLWNLEPGHPIAAGIGEYFELPQTEMYGERFDIPTPDKLIFISWFEGGDVFRSGCCWERGHGRIFYFRPGHETYPIYHDENVQRVIVNAVRWARPSRFVENEIQQKKPPEKLSRPGR
ncbi:MAG: trehalose utilization protein ThuA [Aliifodinibius sp.]|nr:trehalose utilization protein ThuA [Fodinibius sp.]NIY29868.1 trehalose utilization protein ThuA [Fodinibius sp.]